MKTDTCSHVTVHFYKRPLITVSVLEDNADLRTKLDDYSLAVAEFLKLPIDKEETDRTYDSLLSCCLSEIDIIGLNLFEVV